MEQLPSELMINIVLQVMKQKPRKGNKHHNNHHNPVKKKLADAYIQWFCLRLVCKKFYGIASLCAVYPKYERKKLVYLAKVAEEANHYEEMVEIVNTIARMENMEMSEEERQTFADAYKHLTHTKRLSWKSIQTIEQQLLNKYNRNNPNPLPSPPVALPHHPTSAKKEFKLVTKCCGGTVKESNIKLASKYRIKIEEELRSICKSVFELLETSIVPYVSSTEGKVFFIKMRADYLRYLAEISSDQAERQDYVTQAQRSYSQASRLATVELRPSHPLCLSLGLSFALFFSEVLNEPDRGAKMAKATFDAAVGEMEMDARRQSAGLPMWTDDMLDDLRSPKK